jgi:hypothetical protein
MNEDEENHYKIFNNKKIFLDKIYGIETFEDVVNYINNNNLPILTQDRILDFTFSVFINNDSFPNEEYINMVKKCYVKIYNKELKNKELRDIIMKYKHKDNKHSLNYILQSLK